ncbi:hypothetical protein E2C01_084371 [Portunus trituberculatus]|uniref:Uncharacterized protein n=1 Tax=Portunus trituberculatus TaxID=210409 RepID=A0A5B7J3V7_PORTR|nr:hypothetical protein [Portunus trituberculatus]
MKHLRTRSEHGVHRSKLTDQKQFRKGHGLGDALLETVRLMHATLPKLQAGSVKNYWTFKRQFKEFYLDSTVSDTHKLNRLFTSCSEEVQEMIELCMALPANRGLEVALKILDERFGDERMYMNQAREAVMRGPKIWANYTNNKRYSNATCRTNTSAMDGPMDGEKEQTHSAYQGSAQFFDK